MTKASVIAALGALAQETRLDVFRLLVERGPEGMAAGEISERLKLASPTLSFHLNQLKYAGMVNSRRESRSPYGRLIQAGQSSDEGDQGVTQRLEVVRSSCLDRRTVRRLRAHHGPDVRDGGADLGIRGPPEHRNQAPPAGEGRLEWLVGGGDITTVG